MRVCGRRDSDKLGCSDKCEVYSFESSKWTETLSINAKICEFALVYFQHKLWATGGFSGKTRLNTIESCDLAQNKWTTVDTKLLSKRCGHSALVDNKKLFVIGGKNKSGILTSVDVYSEETN